MNSIIKLHQKYANHKLVFKGRSEQTIRSEYYIITPFIRFLELETLDDLKRLKKEDILNYIIQKKSKKNWSARTIKNNLQAFYNFFEYCKTEKIIKKNPAEDIEKPKPPNDLPRNIKEDDALRILEWLYFAPFRYKWERERAKAMLGVFIFTGVRRGELLNIKNSDVDFKGKTIRINNGKGNKDRLIPMNQKLIDILKEYITSDLKKESISMYFFVKLDGINKMGDGTIRALFSRFKKELGVNVSPHKLRHTFGTLMLKNACSLPALSRMMGHSKIETTMVYLWMDTEYLQEEMNKHPFGFSSDLPHKNHTSYQGHYSWGSFR